METEDRLLIIHTDGGCKPNPGPATIGVVIKDGEGQVQATISQYIGQATNNKAEYRAVIAGLEKAAELGAAFVRVYLDSELVLRQLTGEYRIKKRALVPLHQRAKELLSQFKYYELEYVPHESNEAHHLAWQAFRRHRT